MRSSRCSIGSFATRPLGDREAWDQRQQGWKPLALSWKSPELERDLPTLAVAGSGQVELRLRRLTRDEPSSQAPYKQRAGFPLGREAAVLDSELGTHPNPR